MRGARACLSACLPASARACVQCLSLCPQRRLLSQSHPATLPALFLPNLTHPLLTHPHINPTLPPLVQFFKDKEMVKSMPGVKMKRDYKAVIDAQLGVTVSA